MTRLKIRPGFPLGRLDDREGSDANTTLALTQLHFGTFPGRRQNRDLKACHTTGDDPSVICGLAAFLCYDFIDPEHSGMFSSAAEGPSGLVESVCWHDQVQTHRKAGASARK